MKKVLFYVIIVLSGLSSALVSQNNLTPIDSAMIACFPFSGNANDLSGNNNNGTVNGAVLVADRFSNPNSAYSFNGSNQNISVPNFGAQFGGSNEVSLSFWATSTVQATRSAFLFVNDDPNNRFNVHVYYNGPTYWDFGDIFNNGRLTWSNNTLPAPGTWDHWVFVSSQTGNYQKCYKNGVLQMNKSGSSVYTNSSIKNLLIGGGIGTGNSFLWFDGKLDDIRIYKRVLTQNDVTNLYNNNIACSNCPAVASPTNTTDQVSQSICMGNSTTLTAIGTATINWYSTASSTLSLGSGTAFVTPTFSTAGTFTYYIKSVTSCTASAPTAIVFTVNPSPTVQVTASESVICFGQTANLTASGAQSYTWNPGSMTGNSVVVAPASNTTYTVVGKDANGCTNTAYFTVFVNVCNGVAGLNGNSMSYNLYPNPASNKAAFTITTQKTIETMIKISDIRGTVISVYDRTFAPDKNTIDIDLTGVASGIYYVTVQVKDEEARVLKLIKD